MTKEEDDQPCCALAPSWIISSKHLLSPEAKALHHRRDIAEGKHDERILKRRVRDLRQHIEDVLLRSDVAHCPQECVLLRRGQRRLSGRLRLGDVLLVLLPCLTFLVGEVEGLHNLLSSHKGLHRLLCDLGSLGVLRLLMVCRPVDRVGDVGVVELLELLLALLLDEEL